MDERRMVYSFLIALCVLHVTSATPVPTSMPQNDIVIQQHDKLVEETVTLNKIEKGTLDSYRVERFGDPDATAKNIIISGLPSQLTLQIRLEATEEDLLATHMDNLKVYNGFISQIKVAEDLVYKEDPKNYVDKFQEIIMFTEHVIDKITELTTEEKFNGKSLTSNSCDDFTAELVKVMLNVETLKILEEYDEYLRIAEYDFEEMKYGHEHPAPI